MADRIRDVLAADGPYTALMTGGVFTDYAAATDKAPVDPTGQPSAYTVDAAGIPVLRPFALVSEQSSGRAAGMPCVIATFVTVTHYQARGYETIAAAEARALAVLDGQAWETDGGTPFALDWLDSPLRGAEDPSLITGRDRRASMQQLRFIVRQDL